METKICPECGRLLYDVHGNKKYHDECGYNLKKFRSTSKYINDQLKLDPYWLNEKILRERFYRVDKYAEIDPLPPEELGFEPALYRKEILVEDSRVFVMNKFGYSILKNKKIILWKI